MNWNPINKILKKYLKHYKNNQRVLQDKLEDIINSSEFDELNNIGNGNKLKRLLLRTEFEKDSYFQHLKEFYLGKARITNKDILYMTLICHYWVFTSGLNTEQMFNDIIEYSTQTTLKTIPKEHKRVDSDFIKLYIMTLPNHLGWNWLDFKEQEIIYNVIEFIREFNIKKKGLDDLMRKQQRRHLNINGDKYSGSIESHINFLVNQAIVEVGKMAEMRLIKFLGIKDIKQTKMCKSLNDMVFYLDDFNRYRRYSDYDKRVVEYVTKGLVVGENQPPIDNHFHYCRSSMTYNLDYTSKEYAKQFKL